MAGSYYLPSEIVHNILLRLPTKSLLRFQIASKSWYANIWDPQFIKLHTGQSRDLHFDNLLYIGYYESGFCGFFKLENGLRELFVLDCPFASPGETIFPRSSCNGLLLFTIHNGNNVTECVIWNPYPFAQKWTRIKCPPAYVYSLCYDEARDDLKIVSFVSLDLGGYPWFAGCNVYSCKNDTWDSKKFMKVDLMGEQISFRQAIYCIYGQEEDYDWQPQPVATHIVRYDPSSDEFIYFRAPDWHLPIADTYLTTSNESLYFYVKTPRGPDWNLFFAIWVMKDDYSWDLLMVIDYGHVEWRELPMSLHFPYGRNDFVVETGKREMYSIDVNTIYTYIGKVPGDVKGLLINHRMDALAVSSLSKGVGSVSTKKR